MKGIALAMTVSVLLGCNMPSERVQKQFNAVNDSLQQSNDATGAGNRVLHENIDQGNETLKYIDSLKQVLAAGDIESTVVTDKIMISSGEGVRLYIKLEQVYRACRATAADKAAVDSIFVSLQENKNAASWTAQNFKDMPGFAVITLLNKYSNDCKKAMELAAAK